MKQLLKVTVRLFVVMFICFNTVVFGQNKLIPKKPTSDTKKNTVNNTMYLTASFDVNQNKIPFGFKGHNPIELFKKLEKKTDALIKGEFETTAQFEERIKIEVYNPIVNDLFENSCFAFNYKLSINDNNFKYNADKKELELDFNLYHYQNSSQSTWGDSRKALQLYQKKIKERKYYGTNAFGVSQEIYSCESIIYSLLIDNWKSFVTGGSSNNEIKFKIYVESKIAKQIKENNTLSVLLGTLSKPFICKGSYNSGTPTLSTPYVYKEDINYINLKLSEIWIYNKVTGDILGKIRQHENMVCNVSYSVGNRKLISENRFLDVFQFDQEGIITIDVDVWDSGDVISNSIGTPTTIKDDFLQTEAKIMVNKLKFNQRKINDNSPRNGSVTLKFERNNTISQEENKIKKDEEAITKRMNDIILNKINDSLPK